MAIKKTKEQIAASLTENESLAEQFDQSRFGDNEGEPFTELETRFSEDGEVDTFVVEDQLNFPEVDIEPFFDLFFEE
jgi:hypothetical protein